MYKLLMYVCFILFGPVILFYEGASIKSDFSLRSEPLVPALIQTTDRECGSTFFIFHQCSMKYEVNGVEQKTNYKMFAFGAPKTVILLKGAESGTVTSTVGQDYLWNRVFTVIFGLLMSSFVAIAALSSLTGSGRNRPAPAAPHRAPQNRGPQAYTPHAQGFGQRQGFGN